MSNTCRHNTGVRMALALVVGVLGASTCFGQEKLSGFGSSRSQKRLSGFGPHADLWARVIDADIRTAKQWMNVYDKDESGALEGRETSGWSAESHRRYDLNSDGKMFERELTIGIANMRLERVRKSQAAAQAARKKAATKKPKPKPAPSPAATMKLIPLDPLISVRWNMCYALATELIASHDSNRNKQLELNEYRGSGKEFANFSGGADADGNRVITRNELAGWLVQRLPPIANSRLARPLRLLDINGDGQVTLAEFLTEKTAARVKAFRALDADNDGMISPDESYTIPTPEGALGFSSDAPKLISHRATVASTIWVERDVPIQDIGIRIALTKTNDEQLRITLIGPNEKSVVLFTGGWRPWNGSYIFDRILIDDQAPVIKTTLPQAPFPRQLPTDDLKAGKVGLRQFGGMSARGHWRLVVQNLHNTAGVLHHWSIWVKPLPPGGKLSPAPETPKAAKPPTTLNVPPTVVQPGARIVPTMPGQVLPRSPLQRQKLEQLNKMNQRVPF